MTLERLLTKQPQEKFLRKQAFNQSSRAFLDLEKLKADLDMAKEIYTSHASWRLMDLHKSKCRRVNSVSVSGLNSNSYLTLSFIPLHIK